MPHEPLRFMHASCTRLDAPLAAPQLANLREIRPLLRDATLIAFDTMIESVIEHDVDFLLLTGALFGEPITLRARQRFLSGIEMLAEFGIPVFWSVGEEPEAVRRVTRDAKNLTPVVASDPDPMAIIRNGRVCASLATRFQISAQEEVLQESIREPADPFPLFHVPMHLPSVSDWDGPAACYIAASDGHRRSRSVQAGWFHDPGPTQATAAREYGLHGCSLATVDADRRVNVSLVPTAPVRWHKARIGVDRNMTQADLLERMQSALLNLEPHPCERLWILDWELNGAGPLFDACGVDSTWEKMVAELEQSVPAAGSLERQHQRRRRRRINVDEDNLIAEFTTQLDRRLEQGAAQSETGPGPGYDWTAIVPPILRRLDRDVLREDALRLGVEWLEADALANT